MRAYPANTKYLYNIFTTSAQRLRHCINVIQMLCLLSNETSASHVIHNGYKPIHKMELMKLL